jgi:UDP-N-acetylglucosamine enolpyruvyl transferase
VNDIRYIERGYDRLDEKLRGIGAQIERSAPTTSSQSHTTRH